MSDRDRVLRAIRSALAADREEVAHPGPYAGPGGSARWGEFAERLRAVGGEPHGPFGPAELAECLGPLVRAWSGGRRSVAAGRAAGRLGPGPWERLASSATPESVEDVGVAVLWGSLGIAESGAVALAGRDAPLRSLAFLCERVVLLLETDRIVPDMHAAVARMPADATRHHHYTWISGPSKTSDIEQALVLGAHGPRAAAVVGIRPG